MNLRKLFVIGLIVSFSLGVVAGIGQTQQSDEEVTVSFTNVCEQRLLTIQQVVLASGGSTDITVVGLEIQPGQTRTLTKQLEFTPTRIAVGGLIAEREFSFTVESVPLNRPFTPDAANGCVEVLIEAAGGQGETPPPREKPISPGLSLQQIQQILQSQGIRAHRVEGSQANPKLGNVDDPMFLRGIPASSFQLVWVSSGAGQLRSAITWDNPSVDLDLLVFGSGGACLQLTGPGVLSELCDRSAEPGHGPVGGPVSGSAFAVLIVNWSSTSQPYVLSLSS